MPPLSHKPCRQRRRRVHSLLLQRPRLRQRKPCPLRPPRLRPRQQRPAAVQGHQRHHLRTSKLPSLCWWASAARLCRAGLMSTCLRFCLGMPTCCVCRADVKAGALADCFPWLWSCSCAWLFCRAVGLTSQAHPQFRSPQVQRRVLPQEARPHGLQMPLRSHVLRAASPRGGPQLHFRLEGYGQAEDCRQQPAGAGGQDPEDLVLSHALPMTTQLYATSQASHQPSVTMAATAQASTTAQCTAAGCRPAQFLTLRDRCCRRQWPQRWQQMDGVRLLSVRGELADWRCAIA